MIRLGVMCIIVWSQRPGIHKGLYQKSYFIVLTSTVTITTHLTHTRCVLSALSDVCMSIVVCLSIKSSHNNEKLWAFASFKIVARPQLHDCRHIGRPCSCVMCVTLRLSFRLP